MEVRLNSEGTAARRRHRRGASRMAGTWRVHGLAKEIEPSKLFPAFDEDPELMIAQLDQQDQWSRHHPSFDITHGEERAPGISLMGEYVQAGFGEVFESVDQV